MVIKFKYTVDQQHIFKMYDIDREAKPSKKVKFCADCGYFELNEVHIMSNGLQIPIKTKVRNAISPAHYQAKGIELVDVLEAFGLDKFSHRLQAIQYLFRAHVKGNELNDLKKAKWYIDREIDRIQEVWDYGRD